MQDEALSKSSIGSKLPTGHSREADRAELKLRLVKFWDSLEFDRDPAVDEAAASLPYRNEMAAFVPQNSRMLDIACGTCANARWLIPRGQYYGVDISQGLLRLIRQPGLRLSCADAENLPYLDGSFDAVLLTFALEHTVNPVGVLKEMGRVVRLGGRIILLGPTWDLPFWYPNALRSRATKLGWLLRYALMRLAGQVKGWLFGVLPFLIIEDPEALTNKFEFDGDAVYITWSYEVIEQMKQFGCELIHSEVDNQLLGENGVVRLLKRLLMLLPPYRRAGSTALMVFERKK
jgi:ubiquinone/menaquinone biosynthesis C-methylase UbiE